MEALAKSRPEEVKGVTGKGLLMGLKMTDGPKSLQARAREEGLLTGVAGNNVLRLAPPLIVSEDDIRNAVSILETAMG